MTTQEKLEAAQKAMRDTVRELVEAQSQIAILMHPDLTRDEFWKAKDQIQDTLWGVIKKLESDSHNANFADASDYLPF